MGKTAFIHRVMQHGISRAAVLSVALLCMVAQGAWAEDVNYIYYTVNGDGKTITKHEDGSQAEYTVLTSKLISGNEEDRLYDGWYVLNSSFSYGERIVIYGDVKLILKDGCTLTAEQGIRINTDATLTIYAQSEVVGTMGKLVAIETHHDKAAIGGNKNWEAGQLFVHGGEIEADASEGKYAAGIGGGYGDGSGMKEITIYGGKVTAEGAKYGAGIGGGKNNNYPGTINIYGGEVKADGGKCCAGIGGGQNRVGWPTVINGGTVTAQGGTCGAGIGGAEDRDGNSITINGGNIEAKGALYAAGIGGGNGGGAGHIVINGGYVTADGGYEGAGIGAGSYWGGGASGDIEIHGGTIVAKGYSGGAGIGGGNGGQVSSILIDGGTIDAWGSRDESTGGSEYNAFNGYLAAAIGGGSNASCSVTIKNGIKQINLHHLINSNENSVKIGIGSLQLNPKTVILGDNLRVKYSKYGDDQESIAYANNRISVLSREKWWEVTIEPCTNHTLDYTVTAETHTGTCRYCEYTLSSEAHSYIGSNTQCAQCGYGTEADIRTLSFYQTSTTSQADYMASGTPYVQGKTIALPSCTLVPTDCEFVGWLKQGSTPASIETVDGETLLQPGDEYTVNGSETFYARYRYVFKENWQWWIGAGGDQVAVTVNNGSGPQLVYATVTSKVVEATATTPGYTVYTATANYKPNGYTYTFTDEQTVVNYTTVELNETDNTTTLETSNGLEAKAALTGRTLYKNGNWNTLCLPFDVADISSSPLAGATIKEFTDVSLADGTLTLTFADATSIKAGHAYLIKWADSGTTLGPSDLVFTGVTLTKDLRDDEISTDDDGTATVTFMGTYKKLSFDADDKSILFLGENNTLYYPKKGATIGAQRAYFKLSGITAGDKGTGVRTFVLDFGDEDNVTGIIEAEANSSLFTLHLKKGGTRSTVSVSLPSRPRRVCISIMARR